ncbi:Acyl-CoA synthetase (AMP-forming)/AMP-acid ligase II [Brevibacterium jeotgali]|uniref:Acyl-CoA synthetase (AMP-forming)/AMP-acid ligase II n=1 Tax=Brevibacterium jeotgali TaxID=1262550 RepID=A0A2H1L5E6_9MICO|nr:Acyl-CoA synthetase (AMP-forming)/AMP-acid ligase II [Brevibacterium jeotgali]
MPMTQAMLETAERHPERPAIVGERESLTYRELIADSARLFAVVDGLHRAQGHPPAPAPETRGIPIAAISAESAFATARFVAGLAGFRAVSATIDPRWPLEHRLDVIVTTGIGLVVTDTEDLAPALEDRGWTGTVIGLDDFARRIDELGEAPAGAVSESADAPSVDRRTGPRPEGPAVRDGDEAFLMLFSSGTTSNPKAFLKTRDQYRANAAVSTAHLEPFPGVATLAPGPVSYSLTLYAVVECMVTGGSVHVADGFDPLALARRIDEESITRVVVVPAVVRALTDAARRAPERFARLELVVTGGANLPAAIRDGLAQVLPHVRLISYYGAAEIGFIGDSRDGDGTLISIYDGIDAQIREESGDIASEGEIGALWIRAAACSTGYLAGTTDEVLVGPDGWATVHDQGRIVDDRLELVGRAGDIAVTGGHKVALPEVERAFDDVVGLTDVCAVPLPDPALGAVIALVVEAETSEAPTKDALREHVQERLAPQYVPRRWFRVDALPRTVGGKIRRPATRDLVLDGKAERL